MKKYDFIIVGAGLFGCTCADLLTKKGYKVLVIEKNPFIGGVCYTENINGINVHKFGAHIFRTNSEKIYKYFSSFSTFNNFVNSPIAIHDGKAYNLPFNMNTFSKVWDIITPEEAERKIENEKKKYGVALPKNLEEQAINLVGRTIYEMFIKEYTEKQWGKKCTDLPASIIRRIPLRFTYNNNYYNASFQGIPVGGYTHIFEKMLSKANVLLNVDFLNNRDKYLSMAKKVIFTGPIDEYYNYCFGELEYRGLKFIEKIYNTNNYQGNAVLNYSDKTTPYTRSIEHCHFEFLSTNKTVVSYEYPISWKKGDYPYYPINDDKNNSLFNKYLELSKKEQNIIFGGRLGKYQYFDMQDTIESAMELCDCFEDVK